MEHLTQEEIIALPLAEAPAREAAEAHLLTCAQCRQAVEEQDHVWSTLAAWQIPSATIQTEAILKAMGSESLRQSHTMRVWPWPARLAASIAIAASLGIVAAWWSTPERTLTAQEVAAALHLDQLSNGDMTGMLSVTDEVSTEEAP